MTQVKDLQHKKYCLCQNDCEVANVLSYVGLQEQNWTYLIVELDKSGVDINRVWGMDNCNLDSTAYLIYTNQFNEVKQK